MTAQLAIVGMPSSGKTTLAKSLASALGLCTLHTDDFIEASWAEQPDLALGGLELLVRTARPVGVVVEGITVARLFRRGFHPDCVIHIVGGSGKPSLLSLIANGVLDYENGIDRTGVGRVLTVPEHCSLETALFVMGTLGPDPEAP